MESATSSHEVLICQTCGDKGFTNAFVFCVKCLGFVIHRYCLNVLPNTYDEFVPWFCEDCKPPIPNPSTSRKLDPSTSQKPNATTSLLVKTTSPKKKRTNKPKKKLRTRKQFVSPSSLPIKEFRLIKCVIGLEAPSKVEDKSKRDEFVSRFGENGKPPIPNSSPKLGPSTSQKLNATTSLIVKTSIRKKKQKHKLKKKMTTDRQFVSPSILPIQEFRLIKCVIGLEAPSKVGDKRKRDEAFSGGEYNAKGGGIYRRFLL